MKLDAFSAILPIAAAQGTIDIEGITSDSRRVEPGFVFAALSGSKADGSAFVADAVARGAAAVVTGLGARTALARLNLRIESNVLLFPRRGGFCGPFFKHPIVPDFHSVSLLRIAHPKSEGGSAEGENMKVSA